MEKETRISAPKGYVIKAIDIVNGEAVITFKEKERELPKSWDEFCETHPIKDREFFILEDSRIGYDEDNYRCDSTDRNVIPDRATAEAVLALCQLIQLRNAYNGDWVPDWLDYFQTKYVIYFNEKGIITGDRTTSSDILYFKSEELRDEFLRNFRQLIEKLKPLYGIKEGGEE